MTPSALAPTCSIVLPCYNEAETLPQIFARFDAVLQGRTDVEVVFVDNGSKDASSAVFARELARPDRGYARLVRVPVNLGYGHGILEGLRAARGEYLGWSHADSQYDPKIVTEGFALLLAQSKPRRAFIQGKRRRRPLVDTLFTAGMSVVASSMLGTRVDDVNAQPKLFHRSLLERMQDAPPDFSLDLYTLVVARREGLSLVRLPVVFGDRTHGEAKGGGSLKLKWKLTRRTWSFILKLRSDLRASSTR